MVSLTVSPRIRKSPFYQSTVRAGVTDFSLYNKMLMPTSYGDLAAEYRRLVEGVAIWDVSCERQVEVSGPDADDLVQYLTARDLSGMSVGQGKYVAMCDHDGRLLNDPVLLKLADRYWFSLADHDMLLWCKSVAAERGFDVVVTEPDVSPLAVQGPLAVEVVSALCGDWVRDLKYFWFRETDIQGIPVVICRSGWSKQGGYELFLQDGREGDRLWDLVVAEGEPYGIGPGAPNHVERVESGLLSWGGDTTPDSNPFEANMGAYVDVDCKADYIGKAALAVVAAEGPRRLFTGLMIEGDASTVWPLEERVPLTAGGAPAGTMSAVVFSPRLSRTIGLGQVDRSMMEESLQVLAPTGTYQATTHPLPFI
jgi:aminomethyltransferase